MERSFNVKLVRTYKYCPKCSGLMVQCNWGVITGGTSILQVGSISNSLGIIDTFNHKCDKCGHGEMYDRLYPTLEYVDDGEIK